MARPTRAQVAAESRLGERQPPLSVNLLLYFAAVAEELSFTRGARRLGIDQSWMSQKIRELEDTLSCKLFVRTTRQIELTAAGQSLLTSAKAMARAVEEARWAAMAISAGSHSTLRIGAQPYSFANPERVQLVDQFVSNHPNIAVHVSNGHSPVLLERLRRREIDLAFVSWPFQTAALEMLSVREDRFCFLVPKEHRLAATSEILLKDIAGERMVVSSREENPFGTEWLYQPFIDAGVIPLVVAEYESSVKARVAERHRCLALCNVALVESQMPESFTARPIAMHDAVSRKYLVRNKGPMNPAMERFWSMAQARCATEFGTAAPRGSAVSNTVVASRPRAGSLQDT